MALLLVGKSRLFYILFDIRKPSIKLAIPCMKIFILCYMLNVITSYHIQDAYIIRKPFSKYFDIYSLDEKSQYLTRVKIFVNIKYHPGTMFFYYLSYFNEPN